MRRGVDCSLNLTTATSFPSTLSMRESSKFERDWLLLRRNLSAVIGTLIVRLNRTLAGLRLKRALRGRWPSPDRGRSGWDAGTACQSARRDRGPPVHRL